eukprot:gene13491-13616_t
MPPKKDKKDDQKDKKDEAADSPLTELMALQGARQDLELGHAILTDKLKQSKAENERLLLEIEKFKSRLGNATQDYVDILQHREEQIKAADVRASALQQQVERLQADLNQQAEDISRLREANSNQSVRLEDAASLLADKDKLEETVRKQHDLIEQRGHEIKLAHAQLDAKDAALEKAKAQVQELGLKSQATTQLKVMFNNPWLLQTTHVKLKGNVPYDREFNILACSAGGKQLVLHGGQSKSHEAVAKETAVLNLDGLMWEQPDSASLLHGLMGHSATNVGRNKLMVFGGSIGDEASCAALLLSTDNMRWSSMQPTSVNQPTPRLLHAAANLRDKLFVFGGMAADGQLLNDLWVLDNNQWSHCVCYGYPPCPRKGASLCATEDGRRLYLFGGHDGTQLLSDCYYLEVERLMWSPINPSGTLPEPRENHEAAVLGKYMFVIGGCAASAPSPASANNTMLAAAGLLGSSGVAAVTAAGGAAGLSGRRLSDICVLDMSWPAWEQVDDGRWASNFMWLKQMSSNSVMHGNKLYTLQPNLHEHLDQLQVLELTLPEDIERMRSARNMDQEQVDRLELLDNPITTSTSVQVTWRPPSKNSERIASYKLMIASCTGVVREVYQGKALSFTVNKLQPAAEYVFCVKATYDDGSFVWSESRAYHTKLS